MSSARRPDQGGVAGEGDGVAEVVAGGAVAGSELRLLAPARSGAREHVGRALVGGGADVVAVRPDQGGVAGEGDGLAEAVAGGAVAGGELRLLEGEQGQRRRGEPLRRGCCRERRCRAQERQQGGERRKHCSEPCPASRPSYSNDAVRDMR